MTTELEQAQAAHAAAMRELEEAEEALEKYGNTSASMTVHGGLRIADMQERIRILTARVLMIEQRLKRATETRAAVMARRYQSIPQREPARQAAQPTEARDQAQARPDGRKLKRYESLKYQ